MDNNDSDIRLTSIPAWSIIVRHCYCFYKYKRQGVLYPPSDTFICSVTYIQPLVNKKNYPLMHIISDCSFKISGTTIEMLYNNRCLVLYPYNISVHQDVHKFRIPTLCDPMQNWRLVSDIGFDVIDYVELRTSDKTLVRISGRCLCALNILRGINPRESKTLILPFAIVKITTTHTKRLYINVNFLGSDEHYRKEQGSIVDNSIAHIGALRDVVVDYLGFNDDIGHVSLYSANIMLSINERSTVCTGESLDAIVQFREISEHIKPLEINVSVNLSVFTGPMKRLIIVFHRPKCPNSETLQIMKSWLFITNGVANMKFTRDNTQDINIFRQDMIGPRMKSPLGRMNNSTLQLTIAPQDFPTTVTIIGENPNFLW